VRLERLFDGQVLAEVSQTGSPGKKQSGALPVGYFLEPGLRSRRLQRGVRL